MAPHHTFRHAGPVAATIALAGWLSITGVAAALTVPSAPAASSWTVYHGDPAGSGSAGPLPTVDTGRADLGVSGARRLALRAAGDVGR